MKNSGELLDDYIKSGEYFLDAKKWYFFKYIAPFSQRSYSLILAIAVCICVCGLSLNIYSLFPSVIQVKYSISANASMNKTAQIIRAGQVENDPLASIVDVLIRNYVMQRESYDYDKLKKQFVFLKNNSTRIAFRRFYNYMNIDNPSSPVLKYQKNAKRNIKILESKYPAKSKAIVQFSAIANSINNENLEDSVWEVTIDYEVDDINTSMPSGSRFNFTVVEYQLKQIKDNKASKK